MAVLDYRTTCELNRPVTIKHLDGMFFSQDVQANRIVVSVVRGGVNENLSGSVSANIIRADGGTVAQAGEIDGNVVTVTMPAAAYAIPGAIAVFVKHTQDGATSTLAAVTGYVYKSTTDTIVDPGTIIPSVQNLIEAIEDAVATIPQDYQDLEDDVSFLKDSVPKIAETDETESDYDLADAQGYVLARFSGGHIKTKKFDSSEIDVKINAVAVGFEYKFSGDDLLIGFGYNSTYDAVIVMNVGRGNDLFDFSALKLKAKGTSLKNLSTNDLTAVWTSGTDMHSPFQFLAVNDPDGYYSSATDPSYTGGNHKQTINGTSVKTASSKYVYYFADGEPVSSGFGKCSHFEIRWANNVQAYNCVKADGTGRTSMIEYHDMIFDGVRFNEKVTLVPSEAIKMKYWEAFAFVSWGTKYTNVRFVDATNRGVFVPTDNPIKSGNAKASGIVAWGDDHTVELNVDINIDLGKRDYYEGDQGAYVSTANTKGYFRIIQKSPMLEMAANTGYTLYGSFRFYPTVNE